jgi:hypothetical protein
MNRLDRKNLEKMTMWPSGLGCGLQNRITSVRLRPSSHMMIDNLEFGSWGSRKTVIRFPVTEKIAGATPVYPARIGRVA